MVRFLPLLPLLVLLALVSGCAQPRLSEPEAHSSPEQPPAVESLDGEVIAWVDLLDTRRPTLLVFMTAWCTVCKAEQPAVERFARTHADALRTVLVLSGTGPGRARALAAERKIALDLVVDEQGRLARHLGVTGVPTLILFDRGERRGAWSRIESVPVPSPAAGTRLRRVEDEGSELGTTYHAVVLAWDEEAARADLARARAHCRRLEARFSEWREASEISRLNRAAAAGPVTVSDALRRLLDGALHVARATDGAFDITWRPLGEMWDAAERRGVPPDDQARLHVLEAVGWRHVRMEADRVRFDHPRTQLGIAGMAKGWIIDGVFHVLRRAGYEHVIVNIGGDLRTTGRDLQGERRVFRVPDPYAPAETACRLLVEDSALATSGNYFRFREIAGRRYGHILDPRTGRPPDFDGSVTVLTRDAAMADALATALFVMGPDRGLRYARAVAGVEALYVTRDGIRTTLGEASVRP